MTGVIIMFGFRRIAYMLLSRFFWIGLGIGFFLASLFFSGVSSVSAQVPFSEHSGLIRLYGGYGINTDPTSNVLAIRGGSYSTATTTALWTNQTGGTISTGFRQYMFLYPLKLASSTLGVVTSLEFKYTKIQNCVSSLTYYGTSTANPSEFNSGSNIFDVATTSGYKKINVGESDRNQTGIGVFMLGGSTVKYCELKISSIIDNLENEYLIPDIPLSGENGSSTILINPVVLTDNSMLVSTSTCAISSTSSQCSYVYTNLTYFTLENIVLFSILFFLGVFAGYWIVKTFW